MQFQFQLPVYLIISPMINLCVRLMGSRTFNKENIEEG